MNWNANITRVDSNVYSIKFCKFCTKFPLFFPTPFHVFIHHITIVRFTLLKWNQFSCPGVPIIHLCVSQAIPGGWCVFGTPTYLMQSRTPIFPPGARARVLLQLPAPDTAPAGHKVHWANIFALRLKDCKLLKMPYSLSWWSGNWKPRPRAGWPTAFSDTEFSANS